MIKILAFAGSARRDSQNNKLASVAASRAAQLGAKVTLVDLADYPMPLYNGDEEDAGGLPEKALQLQQLMLDHDALLISCPEYNGSITPLLKNVIDWTSRPAAGVAGGSATRGKVAALLSTSPGALGGLRGLVHVRAILCGIGALVVPGDLAVGSAFQAFAEDGTLTDVKLAARLDTLLQTLIHTATALAASPPAV